MNFKLSIIIFLCISISFSENIGFVKNVFTPVPFTSYDPTDLFVGNVLSPKRLDEHSKEIKREIANHKSDKFLDNLLSFFVDVPSKEELDRLFPDDFYSSQIASIQSSVTCNANNDETGDKNLIVFLDLEFNRLVAIDFFHKLKFEQDVMDYIQSATGIDGFPNPIYFSSYLIGGNINSLRNPVSILTDYKGSFWIADNGNGRVIRIEYLPDEQKFQFAGALFGFDDPVGIAMVVTENGKKQLVVVNHDGGYLASFKEPYFDENINIYDLPNNEKQFISKLKNGNTLVLPRGLAVDKQEQSLLFVAHNNSEISNFKFDNGFSEPQHKYTKKVSKDFDNIIGLDSDKDGNIFVLGDNGLIGKYNKNLSHIYTTGGSVNSPFEFENDTYLLPNNINIDPYTNEMFISENWSGYYGLRRQIEWPRFLPDQTSLQLDCHPEKPIESRTISANFGLTKKGHVAAKIYKVPQGPGQDHILLWEKDGEYPTGNTEIKVSGGELGSEFTETGVYRLELTATDLTSPSQPSDIKSYWVDFRDPEFLASSTAIGRKFFNPERNGFDLQFNLSRESDLTFFLAPKGVDVTSVNSPELIHLGQAKRYGRLEEGAHVEEINPFDLNQGILTEMSPYSVWVNLESVPCGNSVFTKFETEGTGEVFFDKTQPTGQWHFPKTAFSPEKNPFEFQFTPTDNSKDLVAMVIDVLHAPSSTVVRSFLFNSTQLSGQPITSFWDGKDYLKQLAVSGKYKFRIRLTDLAGNLTTLDSPEFILDGDAPKISAKSSTDLPSYSMNSILFHIIGFGFIRKQ